MLNQRFLGTTMQHAGTRNTPMSQVWLSSPLISQYAQRNINPVTLQYLLNLGQHKSISECALYARRELPIRLARRVRGTKLNFNS